VLQKCMISAVCEPKRRFRFNPYRSSASGGFMRRVVDTALLCIVSVILVTVATLAHGQTYDIHYNFGSKSGDPTEPVYSGAIAQGRDGNLYSTGSRGGASDNGAVFKITTAGVFTVLYSFDGAHGSSPYGGLRLGTDGNFYGTTVTGGTLGLGMAFKITPKGSLTVLHNFTFVDGAQPAAPPILGSDGNWYGTTVDGGNTTGKCSSGGCGTIYKLTAAGTEAINFRFSKVSSVARLVTPRMALTCSAVTGCFRAMIARVSRA
jgi:uncharacterized repeat protein (TIGR03803 family)